MTTMSRNLIFGSRNVTASGWRNNRQTVARINAPEMCSELAKVTRRCAKTTEFKQRLDQRLLRWTAAAAGSDVPARGVRGRWKCATLDVQMIGGMSAGHTGKIAEMRTGEGIHPQWATAAGIHLNALRRQGRT